jgi:Tol biopolymer transport system component
VALALATGGLLAGCVPPEPPPPPPPPVVVEPPAPLPPPPPPPGRTDQIVYVGAGGIWTMHSDATGVHQLTNDGGFQPEVSRDGQKIAYVRSFPSVTSPGSTYTHIWVMNADGSNQHEVFVAPPLFNPCGGACGPPFEQPADTIREDSPSWSPDGSEIAFVRHPVGLIADSVLAMNADGTGVTRTITTTSEDRFSGTAWSPNGSTIAVTYDYVCCSLHIRLFAADGSGLTGNFLGIRNDVDIVTNDFNPNWAPDSSRIAFDGAPNLDGLGDNGPIGASGTWLANPSVPPNAILLAPASGPASSPSYSPDGTRIAFTRGGTIWSMKAIPGSEGTDQDDTHVAGSDPSWGP